MICASEQSVIVDSSVYKQVKEEFTKRGCHFLNKTELDKVRKTIIINGGYFKGRNRCGRRIG